MTQLQKKKSYHIKRLENDGKFNEYATQNERKDFSVCSKNHRLLRQKPQKHRTLPFLPLSPCICTKQEELMQGFEGKVNDAYP